MEEELQASARREYTLQDALDETRAAAAAAELLTSRALEESEREAQAVRESWQEQRGGCCCSLLLLPDGHLPGCLIPCSLRHMCITA